MKPTRPVLRYHGGKWQLAPRIIRHFPPHRIYVEPFGGGASVLMRKQRAGLVEVYNDLDGEIVNLFRVLRDDDGGASLLRLLAATPYAREEFDASYEATDDPVEQARRTVVRSFMGFGSDAACGAVTGFRANGNRNNGHPAADWSNLPPSLRAIRARLRGVVIEHRDALDCIRQHDTPRTLHYADPPYAWESRKPHTLRVGKGYRHEMTDEEHRELAQVLHSVEGMVVVSAYPGPLYEDLYRRWERAEISARADAGHNGSEPRTEVLWLNPAAVRNGQGTLDFGGAA